MLIWVGVNVEEKREAVWHEGNWEFVSFRGLAMVATMQVVALTMPVTVANHTYHDANMLDLVVILSVAPLVSSCFWQVSDLLA